MGIYGLFATPIGWLMALLYRLIGNYGICIILLTIIVRLCLLPLYSRQLKYQAVMNELQPKINEIQQRYANDREKMNEKLNEVYAQNKVNPLSGCLPLLIQLPIIMGLFSLLRMPLNYMTQPYMIAAVHESFLWISDLCQPDPWILPIAAGVTTYFTYSATSATADGSSAGMMKGMQIIFPVMIFLMGRSFPSGLALYWTVGNLFQVAQTLFFNRKKKKAALQAEAMAEFEKRQKGAAAN